MQDQSRRIFIVVLFALLAILLFASVHVTGLSSRGMPQEEKSLRYPYQQLGLREQKLYTALYNGIAEMQETVKLPALYSEDEYKRIYLLVAEQEPEFFYLDTVFETAEVMNEAAMFYTLDADEISRMRTEMEMAADEILADAEYETREIDKLLAIHDRIAENCSYEDGRFSSEAYGCLVEGKAKCEGYAKAFLYVARRAGLNVMNVTGTDSRGENHVWNIAEADGYYYQIDITWDDDQRYEGRTAHACFGVSDADFTDHIADLNAYTPPVCGGEEDLPYNYYRMNGTYVRDAGELADLITGWPGDTSIMEFRFANAEELSAAKHLISETSEIREAVNIASGAAVYQAMADEVRNVLVILPS